MYLNIGQNTLIEKNSIVGIFDLDNTTWSKRTRGFLDKAEREGRVDMAGTDLPKSFLLCAEKNGPSRVWLTQLNTAALRGRAETQIF